MIKLDGVQRGLNILMISKHLDGELINRFEKKGFTFRVLHADGAFFKKHYVDLFTKPLFGSLVWEGRKIIGATNLTDCAPEPFAVTWLLILVGMSFMEVSQRRIEGKRLPCGCCRMAEQPSLVNM
ncbi:hypothetical protein F8388_022355 [Cannabis sativa]|uniref:Uncharacterized protein n=1 Tax=Cannabis sativa TaxID=3483 RepID=A0A7J6G6G8_CANSA|nr:hypothetical protein F8388_022355 [Cannabis sativa]